MKKIISIFALALITLGLATPVSAAGAITPDEARIISNLKQGVTVNGKTKTPSAGDIAKAENVLKTKDISPSKVDAVINNIEAARGLIEKSKATSWATLPNDVKSQVQTYIYDAASILGIEVSVNPTTGAIELVSMDKGIPNTGGGSGSGGGAGSTKPLYRSDGSIIKQTGANYTASYVVFASLMVASIGALFVGRKYRQA